MILEDCSDLRENNTVPRANHRVVHRALLLLLMLAISRPLQAQNILHYLPEDALGFILVNDLSGASEKCEQLMQMFDARLPAPLALLKLSTNLGEGIDFDGDVLITLIPGPRPSSPPEPLVLLPISSYEDFASSVHSDESGEVARANLAGEDVLIARHGPFAIIMNVENRETLEIIAGLEPKAVALIKPLTGWIDGNLATIGVMPAGVAYLLEVGRQGLSQRQQGAYEEFGDPQFSSALVQVDQGIVFYQMLLDIFGTKVNMISAGFSIDADKNLRIGFRVLSEGDQQSSDYLDTPETTLSSGNSLIGYPDQSFVIAGGGPLDSSWASRFVKAAVQMMRRSPEAYGYEDFQEQHWLDLEASYQNLADRVNSVSMVILPGTKGEPLFGNVFGTAKVDSSSQYLQAPKKSVQTWNRLLTQSSSDIRLQYEIHNIEVGGSEACEIVGDVASAARDPNVPAFNWMLESMFGEDGKLRTIIVAADDRTIVYGIADEQQISNVIDQVKRGETGLQNSKHLQSTYKLLNPAAAWKIYISPQGCVIWTKRIMDELFGQIMQQTTEIPEYDDGPPVGISIHLRGDQAELDLVWPSEGIRALADYVEKCKEL